MNLFTPELNYGLSDGEDEGVKEDEKDNCPLGNITGQIDDDEDEILGIPFITKKSSSYSSSISNIEPPEPDHYSGEGVPLFPNFSNKSNLPQLKEDKEETPQIHHVLSLPPSSTTEISYQYFSILPKTSVDNRKK